MLRALAVYDFDNTLIKGDSLWLFLAALCGRGPAALYAAAAVLLMLGQAECYRDRRTAFKRAWLRLALRGKTTSACQQAAHVVRLQVQWKTEVLKTLEQHAASGAEIVIATGALDSYIATVLEGVPYHVVLCTGMAVLGGQLTGNLKTPNTVRQAKADLVAEYIKRRGPFSRIYGYGNRPSDLPMLALCDDAFII